MLRSCEGCRHAAFQGIRWPAQTDGDGRWQWVERCDTCQLYDTDLDAANAVQQLLAGAGLEFVAGWGVPEGSDTQHPWVEVKDQT
jgi:hypothetical protein